MELAEFVDRVSDFHSLSPREKMRLFAWHLHVNEGLELIDNASVRGCFVKIHEPAPNVARDLPRMAETKPADLIRVRGGYKLSGTLRRTFDERFGKSRQTIAVTKLLADLPSKIPDVTERAFLSEAIDCYGVEAYRAATIMTWNLALDHFLRWITADPTRLLSFNAAITKRFPKKLGVRIAELHDFEELKEFEIIEIAGSANLVPKNAIDILREKLKRRNAAAHPSQIIITQAQADDTITDLVNNVLLPYTI